MAGRARAARAFLFSEETVSSYRKEMGTDGIPMLRLFVNGFEDA
jgi:hypothetical protein